MNDCCCGWNASSPTSSYTPAFMLFKWHFFKWFTAIPAVTYRVSWAKHLFIGSKTMKTFIYILFAIFTHKQKQEINEQLFILFAHFFFFLTAGCVGCKRTTFVIFFLLPFNLCHGNCNEFFCYKQYFVVETTHPNEKCSLENGHIHVCVCGKCSAKLYAMRCVVACENIAQVHMGRLPWGKQNGIMKWILNFHSTRNIHKNRIKMKLNFQY